MHRLLARSVAVVALALGPAAPAPGADPPPPAGPGSSVGWTPTGRQALGRPLLYTDLAAGPSMPRTRRWAFNGGFTWGDLDGGAPTPAASNSGAWEASGAVRGMQMDINPDWVNFTSYDVGPDNVAHGNGLFGATGANRSLSPDSRDFVAVSVRGTVVTGATATLGAGALQTSVKVKELSRRAICAPGSSRDQASSKLKPGCVPVESMPRKPPSTQSASPVT